MGIEHVGWPPQAVNAFSCKKSKMSMMSVAWLLDSNMVQGSLRRRALENRVVSAACEERVRGQSIVCLQSLSRRLYSSCDKPNPIAHEAQPPGS